MIKRNLFFLYLMELCAGSARGAYLVCIGWTTLIVSGDVAAVDQQLFPVLGLICAYWYGNNLAATTAH